MSDSIKVMVEAGIGERRHQAMKDGIIKHVFKAWKAEGEPADHHSGIASHDKEEFNDHVNSVHKHMMKHKIEDPKEGTKSYHKKLARFADKTYKANGITSKKPEAH